MSGWGRTIKVLEETVASFETASNSARYAYERSLVTTARDAVVTTLDADEWAVLRIAELRAERKAARVVVQWRSVAPNGAPIFSLEVHHASGLVERQPSDCNATCSCGKRFHRHDGIGGNRCNACCLEAQLEGRPS